MLPPPEDNYTTVEGNTPVTPPSLPPSQPLWVMCPVTPKPSPTWLRWTPTCLWMSAPPCASPPASCRHFQSVRACDAPWSTSPPCAPCSPSLPGCCTALVRLPGTWCSGCWQQRSRSCGCSATPQVSDVVHCTYVMLCFMLTLLLLLNDHNDQSYLTWKMHGDWDSMSKSHY